MTGFINVLGYGLVKVPFSNPAIYDFHLSHVAPLMFARDDELIQPNRRYSTDMGSIPLVLQPIFPKDEYLLSYILHDSGYAFGGYWINGVFIKQTRSQIDDLLYEMVRSEGCSKSRARCIWASVRMFGIFAWRKGDKNLRDFPYDSEKEKVTK